MENQPPLAGLDPAALLRQGSGEDTIAEDAPSGFEPPQIAELAPQFPQFEFLELIGTGGMGAVYKVRQKDLDRVVALKILPPAIGQSPECSARFTREARALAKLNHPGIVSIHEFGQHDGLHFILMEFVDGVNLAHLMKSGRVSPREALAIVPQICDALQYAHDQGIVHRDIKPENILLDRQGRVKVADFGIAKVMAAVCDKTGGEETSAPASHTLAGNIIGTPQYMAPEQVEHPSDVDHRADIYALGVVFYQMLTGELPGGEWQAPSRKVRIDVRLDEVVLKAMEQRPEMRYQSARDLQTDVERADAPAVAHAKPARGAVWRFRWVFPILLCVFPLIGIAAGMALAYLAPRTYEARAVIEVHPDDPIQGNTPHFFAYQAELIKSRRVLGEVVGELELPKRWTVSEAEAVQKLRSMIRLQSVRGTDLMNITVRHTHREEAAEICNILTRYNHIMREHGIDLPLEVIVHENTLHPRPIGPNLPLLLLTATAGGLLIALPAAFILIALLAWWRPGKPDAIAPPDSENSRIDPLAVTSFAFGIGSLVLWPLGALPAIILGHVSRSRIRMNRGLKGDGFAVAGLALGYVFLAASIVLILLLTVVGFMRPQRVPDAAMMRHEARAQIRDMATPPQDRQTIRIVVSGQAPGAGTVQLDAPASLLDALAAAGGWTADADLSQVRLISPGADAPQIHDVNAILRGEAVNPQIPANAVVEIPAN